MCKQIWQGPLNKHGHTFYHLKLPSIHSESVLKVLKISSKAMTYAGTSEKNLRNSVIQITLARRFLGGLLLLEGFYGGIFLPRGTR